MNRIIEKLFRNDPAADWTVNRLRAIQGPQPIGPRYPTGLFVIHPSHNARNER